MVPLMALAARRMLFVRGVLPSSRLVAVRASVSWNSFALSVSAVMDGWVIVTGMV